MSCFRTMRMWLAAEESILYGIIKHFTNLDFQLKQSAVLIAGKSRYLHGCHCLFAYVKWVFVGRPLLIF